MVDIHDREQLKAVHDNHLAEFLQSLGEYKKVKDGMCKCKFCGKTISIDNIASIFPESGSIKYVCEDMKCVVKMSQYFTNI